MFLMLPANLKALFLNEFKIAPVIEARARFDRRTDRDLNSAASDNRSGFDARLRVGADFEGPNGVSGKLRYQYANTESWTPTRNFSDMHSDLYLGYVNFKNDSGTFSVGRQLLNFGDKRLFEESNFGQRSKSYDLLRFQTNKVDMFAGKVGFIGNRSEQSRLFGGQVKWAAGETLAYFKSDRWVSDANYWTFDHRYTGSSDKLSYAAEGAIQRGTINGRRFDTFMLHGKATYKAGPTTNVYFEANAASGGGDVNTNRGFDAVYGTAHVHYGLSDMQGLRNMNHFEVGAVYKPSKTAEYTVSFHKFSLRDKSDGWYGPGGSINRGPGGAFIDPTGSSGSDVGSELNFMGKWDLGRGQRVELELALFKPGSFIKAFNGASTKDQFWALFTYGIKF
ncbi:MAG: alginate export family protein [Fimbriimonadaceae bacterium]